ncbi:hypothetical protein BDN71DRAFT_1445003 [Pleurotus eryngii]|uniref:Uncharacterized protein n=1 Tax=Pleurotus eryngii TaxID=5323 RepID=A0A9P6A0A5_PLEER|nr:hypothetical protein BDN71DRAFT_1445003 [Pleurotus eryngii]
MTYDAAEPLFVELGKASDAFKKGGVIGYGGDENHVLTLLASSRWSANTLYF